MLYFTLILINIIVCFVISNAAQSREISQTKAFLVSFFLSPIVGMFVVAMSPARKESVETNQKTVSTLPIYDKEDKFVSFFQKYLQYILIVILIVFVIDSFTK